MAHGFALVIVEPRHDFRKKLNEFRTTSGLPQGAAIELIRPIWRIFTKTPAHTEFQALIEVTAQSEGDLIKTFGALHERGCHVEAYG